LDRDRDICIHPYDGGRIIKESCKGIDTGKSLRKTEISPLGEISSCPHNAPMEIVASERAWLLFILRWSCIGGTSLWGKELANFTQLS